MSGHGANPIFFNKKIKIGRPEDLLTPSTYVRQHLIFALDPQPPSKWTSYVYHPLSVRCSRQVLHAFFISNAFFQLSLGAA